MFFHFVHFTGFTPSFILLPWSITQESIQRDLLEFAMDATSPGPKALENKVSADSMGPELLEEITSARALVGTSLQYRLDLIVVNKLLQTSAGVDRLVNLMRDQGLQALCERGSHSITVVSEDGNLELSVSALAREAARREKEKGLPVRLSRSIIPAHLRMRSVAKAEVLAALVTNGKLKMLNVSNNTILKHLPVDEFMQMECESPETVPRKRSMRTSGQLE